jgi:hypothetical protein
MPDPSTHFFISKGSKEKHLKRSLAVIISLVALLGSMAFADAKEDSVERLQNAGDVLKQIMDAPDKGIPEEVLDGAKSSS